MALSYQEHRLFAIQKSTRTRFKIFQKLNEKLRLRFHWYYNLRIDPIYLYDTPEEQMYAIQRSTRTNIRPLQHLHEKIRMRSIWYYKWHIRPEASKIHWAILATYIIGIALGITLSAIIQTPQPIKAATSTVATSTSSSATANSFQRKTWFDGTRYWSAQYNGSSIVFYYSTDGSTWTQNTSATISVNTNDFSIEADNNNAFIVYSVSYNTYVAKANTYPGSAFAWNSAIRIGGSASQQYTNPVITHDSDSKLWIFYYYYALLPDIPQVYAKQSTNANDPSAWQATPPALGGTYNYNLYGNIVSLGSGNMYAIWIDGTAIQGKKYTSGTGWDTSATSIATGLSGLTNNMSAVSDSSGNIHLVYVDSSGYIQYKEYTSSTWQTAVALDSNSGNSNPNLSIKSSTGDLYAYWIRSNTIYEKKGVSPYASANWDTNPTSVYSTGTNTNLTSGYYTEQTNNKVFLEWTNGTASPYSVMFDNSINSIPPVHSCQSQASGDWSTASTWTNCGGTTPQSGDSAEIMNGHTVTLSASVDIGTGNLAIDTGGILNTSTTNYNISANNITITGTLTANGSTINAASNWTSSSGTFTYGTSTVNFTGATPTFTPASQQQFYNLNFTTSGQTVTFANRIVVMNHLTVGSTSGNKVTLLGDPYIDMRSANPLTFNGTYNANPGYNINNTAIIFRPSASGVMPGGTYGDVIASADGNQTITMQGTVTCTTLQIYGMRTTNLTILDTSSNNYAIATGALKIGYSDSVSQFGQLNANSSNINVYGALNIYLNYNGNTVHNTLNDTGGTINVSGSWTNNDTFTPGTGKVDFNGSGDQTISGSASHQFYSLILSKGGGQLIFGANITLTGTSGMWPLCINGDTTINLQSYNLTLNQVTDGIYTTADISYTFFTGTGKLIFLADSAINTESTKGTYGFGNIQIGDATHSPMVYIDDMAGDSSFSFNNVTILNNSYLDNSYSDSPINITGNWASSGNFLNGSSTVDFTAASGTQTLNSGGTGANQSFYNLTHSGASTVQLLTNDLKATGNFLNSAGTFNTLDSGDGTTSRNVTVNGNFTISNLSTFNGNSSTITVGGSWDTSNGHYSRVTGANAKVIMTGTTGSATLSYYANDLWSSSTAFNILQIDASTRTITLSTDIAVWYGCQYIFNSGIINGAHNIYLFYTGAGSYSNSGVTFGASKPTVAFFTAASSASPMAIPTSTYPNLSVTSGGSCAASTECFAQLSGDVTANNLLIGASSGRKGTLYSGGHNITLNGSLVIGTGAELYGELDLTNSAALTVAGYINITNSGTAFNNKLTVDSNASTISVAGNWTNADTFTAGGSTVNMTAASGTQTLTSSGTGANQTFNNLTHSGAGTVQLITNDLALNGSLNLTAGIFTTLDGANSRNLTVTGNLTIATNGTLTANASTITVSGSWDSSAGTFNCGTSTVKVMKNGNFTTKNFVPFYTVELGHSGYTNVILGVAVIRHQLILAGDATGSITDNNTWNGWFGFYSTYTMSDWFTSNGAAVNGNIQFYLFSQTTSSPMTIPASPYYNYINFISDTDSGTALLQLAGDITAKKISCYGDIDNRKSLLDLNGYNLTDTGIFEVGESGYPLRNAGVVNNSTTNVSTVTVGSNFFIYSGSGNNYINAAGTKTINFNIAGNWTNADTFTAGGSTINFTATSGTQTLTSGGTGTGKLFNNLTHSGAGTLQLSTNNLDTDGNFTNSAGTFNTNSLDMTIASNFNNTGGTFLSGTRTVTLDGSAGQTVTMGGTDDNHDFYNLTITNASSAGINFADPMTLHSSGTFTDTTGSSKLTFHAGNTYTIPNLALNGTSGHNIALVSSSPSTYWKFNVSQASPTASYVSVQDSNASGGNTITTTNSTNNGHNLNWSFGSPITISGSCKQFDESTNCTDAETVRVAVNDSLLPQTGSTSSGSWTVSGVGEISTGDVVTAYISGVTDAKKANAVTKYAGGGGNITGVLLYEDHLTIGSSDNQTITNTDLDNYDAGVAGTNDVFFNVSNPGDLSVDNSAHSTQTILYVVTGNTFRPSSASTGNVTTHSVKIAGTINADGNTFTVDKDWTSSSGTYTYGASTINFTGVTQTFTPSSQQTFYNLNFTNPGQTVTFANRIIAMNHLTIGSTSGNKVTLLGGVIIDMRATNPLTLNGSYNANPGYNIDSMTMVFRPTADGGVIPSGTYGTIVASADGNGTSDGKRTISLQGNVTCTTLQIYGMRTGNLTVLDTTSNNYSLTVGTITIGYSDTISQFGALLINNSHVTTTYLTIYVNYNGNTVHNTLDATGTGLITVNYNWLNNDTFTAGNSTVDFSKSSGTQTLNTGGVGVGKSFYHLTHSGAGTLQLITNNLDVNGNLTNSNGTFDINSQNVNVVGAWNNTATITNNLGTVTLDGTTTQVITTNGQSFYNLTLNNTGSSGSDKLTISGLLDINGALTVTDGNLDLATNDPNVTLAGNVTIGANGSWTKQDGGMPSTTFDGNLLTGTFADSSTGGPQDLGFVIVNKTNAIPASNLVTLASSMTVDTMSISANNTLNLGSSGYTFTLANAGAVADVLTNSGTITIGTSTVKYAATNSSGNINIVTLPYNSLRLSGAEIYALAASQTGTNALTGNLTIDSGAMLYATDSNYNITLAGNWINAGTFNPDTSTVTFNGTTTGHTINPGLSHFYNLTFNGSGGAWSPLTNKLYVDNDLTMTNGTFGTASGTADVEVVGNVQCGTTCGVINMTSTNTFTQNVVANKSFGTSVAGTTAWTFNNLTFNASNAGSTQIITTNTTGSGDITVNGTLSTLINLNWNAGNRTWHLTGSGHPFMPYTIDPGTSTFSYESPSNTTLSTINQASYQPISYYNLKTNPSSSTPTYAMENPGGSFLAGTKVKTDNGYKNIEDFKIGDKILSYDTATSQPVVSEVTDTTQKTRDAYYIINDKVKATGNHIFILSDDSQKSVQDLKIGDSLKTFSGQEMITSIQKINQTIPVYDLVVKNYHLFYAENYLVHNGGDSNPFVVNNDFTLTGSGSATVDCNPGVLDMQIANNLNIGANQTMEATSRTTTINGSFTNSGIFHHNNGTVNITITGKTVYVTSGGSSFYNFYFEGVAGDGTLQLQDNFVAAGNFTFADGTFNQGTASMTVAGNFTNGPIFNYGSGGILFNGTTTYNDPGGNNIGNVTIASGHSVTLGTTLDMSTLSVAGAGTLHMGTGGTLYLNGTGNVLTVSNFDRGTNSTVYYESNDPGTSVNVATVPYANIYLEGSSTTTYSLTGNLTNTNAISGNLTLNTATLDITSTNYSIDIAGNWLNSSGVLNSRNGTVNFTATSGTQTIDSGGTGDNKDFFNIDHTSAGTLQVINNDLEAELIDLGAGTFDANGRNVTTRDLLIEGGTYLARTGTTTVYGYTHTSGTATWTNSTLYYNGQTDQSLPSDTYNNLTLTNEDGQNSLFTLSNTTTVTGNLLVKTTQTFQMEFDLDYNLTVNGNVTINDGQSKVVMSSVSLSIGGNYANNGTFTAGSGTVNFTKSGGTQTINSGGTGTGYSFNNLTHSGGGTLQLTTNKIDINGNFTNSAGPFDANSLDMTVAGNWTNSSTFAPGTCAVTFDGTVTGKTINAGSSGFYTLTINGTSGGWTLITNNLTTLTNLNVTAGTLNTGTVNLGTVTSSNITVNGGTLTSGSGTISAKTLTVSSGTFTASSSTTLGNSSTSGSYTHTGGTVDWTTNNSTFSYSSTGNVTLPSDTYKSLALGSCTTLEITVTYGLAGNTTVSGDLSVTGTGFAHAVLAIAANNLTVNGSATITYFSIFSATTGNLSIGKNYTNSGTFTAGSGTVNFTAASGTQTLNSGGTGTLYSFNNLTHSGAGTLQLLTNNLDINGDFTNSAGTFDANGLNINIAKNWNISGGSFSAGATPGNQKVTFDSTNKSTITGSTTFNNLTMDASVDGAKKIDFTNGTTQTISSGKTWTLNGASGKVLTLRSTSTGNAWNFYIYSPMTSGTYIDVEDSYSANTNKITPGANVYNTGNNPGWLFNQAPNAPTNLKQTKTDDTTIATGQWVSATSIKFTATATDPDSSDTLKLCVEIARISRDLGNSDFSVCGSPVAYSGTPVTVSVTVDNLVNGIQYHWHAGTKDTADELSDWTSYGNNTDIDAPPPDSDPDFGIDTSAPTGGAVNDGTGSDQDWNDGSLTGLSANWNSFTDSASGINYYTYKIYRQSDGYYWNPLNTAWQSGETWINNGAATTATVSAVTLQTGDKYYFTVCAVDNVGNTSSPVSSNGQQVLPTLSFQINNPTVTFSPLNLSNNYQDTQTDSVTSSTNAAGGYVIYSYITQLLTATAYPTNTINNFSGTWSSPATWGAGTYGFGYTSSDTLVQGSDRFSSGTKYAGHSLTAPGDIIADHTDPVNGTTGPVSNETFTFTYKLAVSSFQAATTYKTNVSYIISPTF